MRKIIHPQLENGRVQEGDWGSDTSDGLNGAFIIMGPKGSILRIIASDGKDPIAEGWEHVSVSLKDRCPTWEEMCYVKNLFWTEEECVIQFHPPKSEYVNCHPNCLHLWGYALSKIPTPPTILVGPKR